MADAAGLLLGAEAPVDVEAASGSPLFNARNG